MVNFLLGLLLAPFALLTLCFAIELYFGLRPLKSEHCSTPSDPGVASVIIVPAHDEAAGLRKRLDALKEAASPTRILVVADNCRDLTADIARELGVDVIERIDPARRGKGFALDFAKRHLSSQPPDVVIVVDADCSIDAASIQLLVAKCSETAAPCQATNLQRPQATASPTVQISTFAFFVKNVIRQRALTRLAGRVQLLGTGMAMPWSLFSRANLATSSIVEDIKLGHELAEAGHAPILIEGATVWSEAETTANTLAQRQRWEGGFLNEAMRQGPSRLVRSIARGDLRASWAALSIMVPPFALLVLADLVALTTASLIAWAIGASLVPLLLLAVPLLLAVGGLLLVWRAGGSRFIGAGTILRAPLYLAWKLPMYFGFLRRGVPKKWTRTGRN
jgi:cellulose synthase/poly-beta-1,6-N-acetylglucosamine synthase-like glycosyltransferase